MCKILIFDDEPNIREVVRDSLSSAGHQVCEAGSGRVALAILMRPTDPVPCVVIVDLRMPDMDGWDLVAAMKREARLRHIPVIVFSASVKHNAPPPVLGAHAYWPKPLLDDRLEQIHTHCPRHATSRSQ
jgi:CheY-like chemotaxis protein